VLGKALQDWLLPLLRHDNPAPYDECRAVVALQVLGSRTRVNAHEGRLATSMMPDPAADLCTEQGACPDSTRVNARLERSDKREHTAIALCVSPAS
jgi:hypothetical protein